MTFCATISVRGSLRSTRLSERKVNVYALFNRSMSSGVSLLSLSNRLIGIAVPGACLRNGILYSINVNSCTLEIRTRLTSRHRRSRGTPRRSRASEGGRQLKRSLAFRDRIRALEGRRQFAGLVLQIGGEFDQPSRKLGIGSRLCHLEQRHRWFRIKKTQKWYFYPIFSVQIRTF